MAKKKNTFLFFSSSEREESKEREKAILYSSISPSAFQVNERLPSWWYLDIMRKAGNKYRASRKGKGKSKEKKQADKRDVVPLWMQPVPLRRWYR